MAVPEISTKSMKREKSHAHTHSSSDGGTASKRGGSFHKEKSGVKIELSGVNEAKDEEKSKKEELSDNAGDDDNSSSMTETSASSQNLLAVKRDERKKDERKSSSSKSAHSKDFPKSPRENRSRSSAKPRADKSEEKEKEPWIAELNER